MGGDELFRIGVPLKHIAALIRHCVSNFYRGVQAHTKYNKEVLMLHLRHSISTWRSSCLVLRISPQHTIK